MEREPERRGRELVHILKEKDDVLETQSLIKRQIVQWKQGGGGVVYDLKEDDAYVWEVGVRRIEKLRVKVNSI